MAVLAERSERAEGGGGPAEDPAAGPPGLSHHPAAEVTGTAGSPHQ